MLPGSEALVGSQTTVLCLATAPAGRMSEVLEDRNGHDGLPAGG